MSRITSALSVAAFALATLPAMAADQTTPVVFALTTQNGSGEYGTVVLTPMGAQTKVDVAVVGAPAGVVQPDHIHTGTCAKLDPKPTYGLAAITNGVSTTLVNVPIATLLASPFVVNVHKSATEIGVYVACANLSMPAMKM
jgi:hypothetical protein